MIADPLPRESVSVSRGSSPDAVGAPRDDTRDSWPGAAPATRDWMRAIACRAAARAAPSRASRPFSGSTAAVVPTRPSARAAATRTGACGAGAPADHAERGQGVEGDGQAEPGGDEQRQEGVHFALR